MGVEGTLDYFTNLFFLIKKRKKKATQTVVLRVRMDCEGCARKMKHVLSNLRGAKSVDVDLKAQKVTVIGYVDAKKVLAAAKATKKKVELWPYVPYSLVAHPYVSQSYDKKAPPNHVRDVPAYATFDETTLNDQYTTMFSDDNPHACSIM